MGKKKSIKLFVISWISFLAVGLGNGIYCVIYSVRNHLNAIEAPSLYRIIFGIFVLLFFDPMLILTCWHAKKERERVIGIISLILLVHITIVILSTIISLL